MTIKGRVTPQGNRVKGQVNSQQKITVSEYRVNVDRILLGDLFNVDTTNASDGAVLVFNGNTANFEATTRIENPNTQVNGGHY